jgi:hypothetical protein
MNTVQLTLFFVKGNGLLSVPLPFYLFPKARSPPPRKVNRIRSTVGLRAINHKGRAVVTATVPLRITNMEKTNTVDTASPQKQPLKRDGEPPFVTEYVHYRTRKLMKASDYGYKAWPFGNRRKKR